VETLLERCIAVFAINPKQLDRFRDRFSVAGSKNDRLDARVLADSLRTDPHRFRRVEACQAELIELREWSRLAETLKQEHTRLSNRIREQLRRYYPQMSKVTEGDVGSGFALDLWEKLPSPAKSKGIHTVTIARLLKRHRIRRISAADLLGVLRQPALEVCAGTVDAAQGHIRVMAALLRVVNHQLAGAHQRIDALCEAMAQPVDGASEPSDVQIIASFPGVGRIVLAILLSEASQAVKERDYRALRALSGVAPVTRQSGKSSVVTMRRACHPRLRNALHYWSQIAAQHDPASSAKYAALRARGHKHARALRTIGDRLLNVVCKMLSERTLFDPKRCPARAPALLQSKPLQIKKYS
jgi:transposase